MSNSSIELFISKVESSQIDDKQKKQLTDSLIKLQDNPEFNLRRSLQRKSETKWVDRIFLFDTVRDSANLLYAIGEVANIDEDLRFQAEAQLVRQLLAEDTLKYGTQILKYLRQQLMAPIERGIKMQKIEFNIMNDIMNDSELNYGTVHDWAKDKLELNIKIQNQLQAILDDTYLNDNDVRNALINIQNLIMYPEANIPLPDTFTSQVFVLL